MWPSDLPTLRTPTLLRRRGASDAPHLQSHTQAVSCLLITCLVMLFTCNVRQLQNAFRVPRGVYYLPRRFGHRHNNTVALTPRHCRFLRDQTLKAVPPACGLTSRANMADRKARLALLVTSVGGAGSWHASLRLRDAGLRVEHERLGRDGAVCWLYAVRDGSRRPYPVPPAAAAVRGLDVRFRKVLHLVRCPASNVAALSTHRRETLAFAARALGLAPPPADDRHSSDTLERSTYRVGTSEAVGHAKRRRDEWLRFLTNIWSHWNSRIERFADARSRIEDDYSGAALCDLVDLGADGPDDSGRVCLSSTTSAKAALDTAQKAARAWSQWVSARGDFNPRRCIRGACGPHTPHHRRHANVSWADLEDALSAQQFSDLSEQTARYGYGTDGSCSGLQPEE